MSLGQLTAYADSDNEDDVSGGEEKSSSPSPSSTKTEVQVKDQESSKSTATISNETTDSKQDSPSKTKIKSPEIDKEDSLNNGLSGIIEDEDEVSSPPARVSVTPLRVGKLKATEGGGSGRTSPVSVASGGSGKNTPVKKVNRLVSYIDEDMEDSSASEEEPDDVLHSEPMDTGSTDGEDDSSSQPNSGPGSRVTSHPSSPGGTPAVVTVDGIKLPSPPRGKKCPKVLQEKIARAVSDVSKGLRNYNTVIQNNKEFRNPSIYEKLVDLLRLDENGTNYPVALYDPHCWGKESFYEALAKTQKEEMEKREKEKKERTKVDFISGPKKAPAEEEIKKRKSRFDSGRPEGTAPTAVAKPVSLVSNISASSLGKTTIDAFGGLNKKLKT